MIDTLISKSWDGFTKAAKHSATAFFVSLALISFLDSSAYAEEAITLQSSAIAEIQAADAAGADTTELVDRLNIALGQAESLDVNSCIPSEECTDLTTGHLQSIAGDANTLRDNATRASYVELAISLAIAIIAAFIVAFVALFLYHYRDSIQVKRYLRLALPTRVGKH